VKVPCTLTEKQQKANELLGGDATHTMLFGGSRSGKTFLLVRALITRALAYKSRHAAMRYRFNHIKASIVYDTLPSVMEKCFPGVADHCHLDKSDWFYTLPNGSEVWFGGLDDKERTEKILGQEYATILFNECSQIPWASRNMAITRLAQNTPLRLKAYYDCNPPSMAHWTYRVFSEKRDPDSKQALRDPLNYTAMLMNPADNAANLPAGYLDQLDALPERMRRRFMLGQFADASEHTLWTMELLDQQRVLDKPLPDMVRIIVAVDPSGCSGEEDKRSDEIGIVVVGLGMDGKGYVLEDLSGKMGPNQWAKAVVAAYHRHAADCVVAEVNFGGAMVGALIKAEDRNVPFKEVTASRGKVVRAEPISSLFELQKVWVVGYMPELEDQLCAMTTFGYTGNKSPDRADAMVWGLTELFPGIVRKEQSIAARTPRVMMGHPATRRR